MSAIANIPVILPTTPVVSAPVQVSAPTVSIPVTPAVVDQVAINQQAQQAAVQQAAIQQAVPITASVVYKDANNNPITYTVDKTTGKHDYSPEPSFIHTTV